MSSAPIYNFNQAVSADAFEVEEFRRRTRLHEEATAEAEKSISSIKPSRRIRVKKNNKEKEDESQPAAEDDEGGPTLLDLKHRHLESMRKDKEDMQDQDGGYKRFQMEEYTSEDSHLKSKGKLIQYYCSLCGQMALVTDCPLNELPRRSTDNAVALDENKHFHKKYLALGQRVCLDRGNNKIEIQYRYNCKNNRCGIPIAYRTTLEDTEESGSALFTYIIKGSLLKEQSKAARFNATTRAKFLDADSSVAASSTEEE